MHFYSLPLLLVFTSLTVSQTAQPFNPYDCTPNTGWTQYSVIVPTSEAEPTPLISSVNRAIAIWLHAGYIPVTDAREIIRGWGFGTVSIQVVLMSLEGFSL
ncbi:hypothetical protein FPQ18DRAFT_388954 [Pyronema domesticum]|nr:hypothetical protein FPQ18DRAFT_388954 [Pyronema domesticum]